MSLRRTFDALSTKKGRLSTSPVYVNCEAVGQL